MRVLIPNEHARKLTAALERAGNRETGGQLFGEQLAPSEFRVMELTLQSRPGTLARFAVDLLESSSHAVHFFTRTRHQYTRYNYIGEWHSHPNFDVLPSRTDVETMRRLVRDRDFFGSFAVLMIARLDESSLRSGAWLFASNGVEQPVTLEIEHEH